MRVWPTMGVILILRLGVACCRWREGRPSSPRELDGDDDEQAKVRVLCSSCAKIGGLTKMAEKRGIWIVGFWCYVMGPRCCLRKREFYF